MRQVRKQIHRQVPDRQSREGADRPFERLDLGAIGALVRSIDRIVGETMPANPAS